MINAKKKVFRILVSCKTEEQLQSANNLLHFFTKKFGKSKVLDQTSNLIKLKIKKS